MKACVLRERLYVPLEYVTDKALDAFTYNFEQKEKVYDENGRVVGNIPGFVTVHNFKKIIGKDEQEYYGFARGDLGKLKKFFGEYEWIDKRVTPPMTSAITTLPTLKLKNFPESGVNQTEVVEQFLKVRSGVIKAPPRYGKTVTALYIALQMRQKTVIITHQEDLLEQFLSECEEFTNLLDLRTPLVKKRDATGQIIGYFYEYDNPGELDICLICWQTFASKFGPDRLLKYRDTWGLSVIDEVHKAGAFKYASVVNVLNAKHRLGLTGTLQRVDRKEKIFLDIVGPVVARGVVKKIPCAVTVIHTAIPVKYRADEPLPYLYKRLYAFPERTEMVIKYLKEDVADGFFICVGFHRASQMQLEDFTDTLGMHGFNALSFYGKTPNRKEVLATFKSGGVQVAVCNVAMLTGVNIPRWNCFYRMFPSANVVFGKEKGSKVLELGGNDKQEYDRIRTPFTYENGAVKKFGLIRDFVDENKFCEGCFKKRLKCYEHEEFVIEHIYEHRKEKIRV